MSKPILLYKIVHCEWNDWNFGTCSKPCGGGERTNNRDKKVSAEHEGDECEGASSITESCNVQECPGKTLLGTIWFV